MNINIHGLSGLSGLSLVVQDFRAVVNWRGLFGLFGFTRPFCQEEVKFLILTPGNEDVLSLHHAIITPGLLLQSYRVITRF